jgi:hypothetical protein
MIGPDAGDAACESLTYWPRAIEPAKAATNRQAAAIKLDRCGRPQNGRGLNLQDRNGRTINVTITLPSVAMPSERATMHINTIVRGGPRFQIKRFF